MVHFNLISATNIGGRERIPTNELITLIVLNFYTRSSLNLHQQVLPLAPK